MQLGAVVKEKQRRLLQRFGIDIDKYEVRVKGKKVGLTPLEFDLLRFLAENEGKVFQEMYCLINYGDMLLW